MTVISVNNLKVLAGVFTAVAISLTTGRFFIRNRNGGSGLLTAAALSDHLNGAAAVVLVGMVAAKSYFLPLYYEVQLWAADLGPGVEHKDMITYYQVGVGTFMLFWVVIYLVKFSFLMLYRSLFAVSKSFRAVWWGVFVFNMMAFFICFLSVLWTCGHPGKLFNTKACATRDASNHLHQLFITGCVFNVLSSLTCMVLPLGMLRSLRISFPQKLGLACIFGLALVDIAIDILRIVITFTEVFNTALMVFEPIIAVINCALPVYRGVLRRTAGRGQSKWRSISRSWFSTRPNSGSAKAVVAVKECAIFGTGRLPRDSWARLSLQKPAATKKPWQIAVKWDLNAESVDSSMEDTFIYHGEPTGPQMDV